MKSAFYLLLAALCLIAYPQDARSQNTDAEISASFLQELQRRAFPDIHFETDKYTLSAEAREVLASTAQTLKENAPLQAVIGGYTDERGSNEYNLALAESRAATVQEYLQSLGISSSRLRTVSYGEERPVCTESTEACWARNRRTHFVVSR